MSEEVEDNKEKKEEDWMQKKWRPAMGWMYMAVCMFDFMLAPVLWSIMQALDHGNVTSQWQPLTLQGAGLFHVAMGAVLGIAAYGRTQEKLGGAASGNGVGGMPAMGTMTTSPTPMSPAPINTPPVSAPMRPMTSMPVPTSVTTTVTSAPRPAPPPATQPAL